MGAFILDQKGDVYLFNTLDGGDINLVYVGNDRSGSTYLIEFTPTFDTMIYLVLKGSNDDDPGGDDKSKQWWGNFTEEDPARHYRSEYQYLVQNLPATTENLRLLEAAAARDFERAFIDTKIADSVTVTASIPKRNVLKMSIEVEAEGSKSQFEFTEIWEASIQ